jgi:hypothetical protein
MQTLTSGWVPLLPRSSDGGRRAWAASCTLAAVVVAGEEHSPAGRADTGDAALLFSYLSTADDDRRWRERAIGTINAAIDDVDALHASGRWGLQGLAGLGWNVEHLCHRFFAGAENDCNGDTDLALLRELERGQWRGPCDLESGLAGLGVYFLERLPARSAVAGLKLVVDHLQSLALNPGPSGLSHASAFDVVRGLPGMMYVLAEAVAADVEGHSARALLEGAARWFRDHDGPSAPLSWCRDLGTAAISFRSARITGRDEDREFAAMLLDRCTAESPLESSANVSLRNGTAGIAHAFARIGQWENDPLCRQRAIQWYERTLDLLQSGQAVFDAAGDSLLDGRAGTALALLAASTDADPLWDRRLALSGSTP